MGLRDRTEIAQGTNDRLNVKTLGLAEIHKNKNKKRGNLISALSQPSASWSKTLTSQQPRGRRHGRSLEVTQMIVMMIIIIPIIALNKNTFIIILIRV